VENLTRTSFIRKIIRSKAFTLFILLALMIVVFTILASLNDAKFFNLKTLRSVLYDLGMPAFLAIGAGCLLVSGGMDFSEWTVGMMAGMVMSIGITWWGIPWWACAIIAVLIAGFIGALNAVFVNFLNLAPFIVTMAMASVVRAVAMLIGTDSAGAVQGALSYSDDAVSRIGTWALFGEIPGTILVMIAFYIIYGLMLSKTKLGRSIYMLGGNPKAARLSGINSKKISFFLFINCSMMGAIAGLIYSMRAKQGSLSALAGEQFTGMSAAILGGISFGGGSGGLGGAFLGLLVIKTFNKGMAIIGSSTFLTQTMQGVLLIAALVFDYFSQRRQQKRVGA